MSKKWPRRLRKKVRREQDPYLADLHVRRWKVEGTMWDARQGYRDDDPDEVDDTIEDIERLLGEP